MGEDDVPASVASLVLAVVAAHSMGRSSSYGYTHPLMHVNLTVHGIIALIHYQSSVFGVNTEQLFPISVAAAKFLPLAGLNSDCYRTMQNNNLIPIAFILTGFIPVYLAAIGQKDEKIGNAILVANVLALGYNGVKRNCNYSFFTAALGAVAGFAQALSPVKALFPLALAGMDHCATQVFGFSFNI